MPLDFIKILGPSIVYLYSKIIDTEIQPIVLKQQRLEKYTLQTKSC